MKSSAILLGLLMSLALAVSPTSLTAPQTSVTADVDQAAQGRVPYGQFATDVEWDTVWKQNIEMGGGVYNVGVTDVQDTLMWVSAGQTQLKIYRWRIDPTRTFIDSFPQTGGPSGWGVRDMAYDEATDYVYAGFDGGRYHVYNATTMVPVNTYTVSGFSGTVRAMAHHPLEDSLWTANFSSNPMWKFSVTGTNGHQVKPAAQMGSCYGLAWDPLNNCFWSTNAGASGASPMWKIDYPSYTVSDSFNPAGWDLGGGCEMWRDNYLLALEQATPDMVWCIRIGGSAPIGHDLAMAAILAPSGNVMPGAIAPRGRIQNLGTNPESNFPVTCWIDSGATRVYNSTYTYTGTLNPGATAEVTFTPNWTAVGGSYNVTMFTNLTGDERRSNDTLRTTVTVTAAVWETIPQPPANQDRLAHAVVYDPLGDKLYMIGGNPAGQSGTYLTANYEYNPATRTWATKASMPTARGWLAGSVVDGKIYIIGGHNNSGQAIATNECFDIAANTWSTRTARPRIGLAAAEVVWRDSLIYVLGGNNASTGFNNVDIYDATADAWSVGTALPFPLFMGSAGIIGDTIFIAQGYNNSACWPNLYKGVINPANPTQITWTAGPTLAEPVFNGGTAVIGGDVYWLGGFINAATVTNKWWKYSTATGAVTAQSPLYPVTLARCNFMASRPSTSELYVLAGDMAGDWTTPNRQYWKISLAPQAVAETPAANLAVVADAQTFVRGAGRVSFSLAKAGNVNLSVFNTSGRLVTTLVNGTMGAGNQTVSWNGTDANGRRVAGGTYFYRLTVDGQTASTKAIVLN